MNKKLAIKGHPTRGKEVIEILEMLGGVNGKINRKTSETYNIYNGDYFIHEICDTREVAYYIDFESQIRRIDIKDITTYFIVYSLEGFLEEHPYKIGDKVNYVKYNDEYPSAYTIQRMRWTGATIEYLLDSSGFSALTKDLQPYKVEEYLEYVSNIRQPQYPKTYEECAEILLERASVRNDIRYKGDLLVNLQRLLICRDAYWFIYNNWKPTHKSGCDNTIYTIHRFNEEVIKGATSHRHSLLEFPTEEMRDEFYENFKTLIFACKELI